MSRQAIDALKNVSETMLITLWARAEENKHENPIINDPKAATILKEIDYDFSKFNKAWASQVGVCVRSMLLDKVACGFFADNKNTVVVNLGAGLDTRFDRLKNENFSCWYDLDVPEGIAVRKTFFAEDQRNIFISKSVFDPSWVKEINANGNPVLFIAEGLFMYFDECEMKTLFKMISENFPGSDMLFDVLPQILVGKNKHHDSVKKMKGKAEFKWGLNHTQDLESWYPGIRFNNEWDYLDYHKDRWKILRWMGMIPWVKNAFKNRIVHINF